RVGGAARQRLRGLVLVSGVREQVARDDLLRRRRRRRDGAVLEQRVAGRVGRLVAVDRRVVHVVDRDRELLLEAQVRAARIVHADADRVRVLDLVVEADRALQLRAGDLEAARVGEAARAPGGQQRERVGLAAVRVADL